MKIDSRRKSAGREKKKEVRVEEERKEKKTKMRKATLKEGMC